MPELPAMNTASQNTCNSTRRWNNRAKDADVTCREDDFDLSFGSSDLPALPVVSDDGESVSALDIRLAQAAAAKAQTCA